MTLTTLTNSVDLQTQYKQLEGNKDNEVKTLRRSARLQEKLFTGKKSEPTSSNKKRIFTDSQTPTIHQTTAKKTSSYYQKQMHNGDNHSDPAYKNTYFFVEYRFYDDEYYELLPRQEFFSSCDV